MMFAALTSLTAMAVVQSPEGAAGRVPVSLTRDDGPSLHLGDALEAALRTRRRLRLVTAHDEPFVTIESDRNVGWDRLGGRLIAIYTVFIHRGEDRGEAVTGICYARRMSKCVHDILRIADLDAEPS